MSADPEDRFEVWARVEKALDERDTARSAAEASEAVLAEVARWMRDVLAYPFDFVTSVRPPEALIEALVAVWTESDPATSEDDWRWAIHAEMDWQAPEAETPLGEDIDSSGHTDDL